MARAWLDLRSRWSPLAAVAAVSMALSSCDVGKSPALPLPTAIPSPRTLPGKTQDIGLEASCTVQPARVLKVKSQASGEVLKVLVRVGDRVRPGDLLIQISTRDTQLQIERLEIAEQRAIKRAEVVQIQLERSERETEATRQLYSDARLAKEATLLREKQLEADQIRLELLDLSLQKADLERVMRQASIRATLPATVLARSVEPGQIIGAAIGVASGGDVLLELGDTAQLVLDCAVHASDAPALKPGLGLIARRSERDSPGVPVTVKRVAPSVETVGGVAQLRFTAQFADTRKLQTETGLLPGMRMTATPAIDGPHVSMAPLR